MNVLTNANDALHISTYQANLSAFSIGILEIRRLKMKRNFPQISQIFADF